MEEVIKEAPVATLTDSCLLGIEEPTSVQEASKEAAWKNAMQIELKSIEDNNTWKLADLPTGHKAEL